MDVPSFSKFECSDADSGDESITGTPPEDDLEELFSGEGAHDSLDEEVMDTDLDPWALRKPSASPGLATMLTVL
jgi:hypothetical protein